MKRILKITILIGICTFFLTYTFADDEKTSNNRYEYKLDATNDRSAEKEKFEKEKNKNWVEKIQDKIFKNKSKTEKTREKEKIKEKKSEDKEGKVHKSGSLVPCYQKSGFKEKIKLIKDNSTEKLYMLDKISLSLEEIIPLVKDNGIKKNLEKQRWNIQKMKKNYVDLNLRIENKSRDVCDSPSFLKKYNEETKKIIGDVKDQLKLLKK